MAAWPVINPIFLAGWANLMLSALWQGSLVIIVVWILLRLFPGIHPSIQCWLWRLACLKPLFTVIWVKPLKLYFHLQIGLRQLGWLVTNSPHPSRHLVTMAQPLLNTVSLPVPDERNGYWFLLWLTGLGILIAGSFHLEYRRRKNGNSYVPITDPAIIGLYQALGRRNKFRKTPQLFTANGIFTPLLQGIIKPKIIMPASMLTDYTVDELCLILGHELAHYKRGDLFWNWLPALTRTLFFFLPYIRWVEKKIAQLQEICCDQLAVEYTKTHVAKFGKILLKTTLREECLQKAHLHSRTSVGFASQSLNLLKSRLKALQSVNQLNRRNIVITAVVLLTLGITMLFPWQLVYAQSLPVNLVISYYPESRLDLSARINLPKKEIKAITVLIDGKQLTSTYNANAMYLGFANPTDNNFPLAGLHQVTVKVLTTTQMLTDEHWIYFYDSMIWSSQNLGLESNKTVIKTGPFFWIVNNRSMLYDISIIPNR